MFCCCDENNLSEIHQPQIEPIIQPISDEPIEMNPTENVYGKSESFNEEKLSLPIIPIEQPISDEVPTSNNENQSDGPDKLYIDILNYAEHFFQPEWSVTKAMEIVRNFISASNQSNFRVVKCFIDDSNPSQEAISKWKTRREREIKNGIKAVPQGLAMILGDLFRSCGAEVHYSSAADNDDTLASHAHFDRAVLLSKDKDFLRYRSAEFKLYNAFEIIDNELRLSATATIERNLTTSSSMKDIESPPLTNSHVCHVIKGSYRRGTPSPLVRALGVSPHSIVAPLRHAALVAKGMTGVVTEIYPEWDPLTESVVWNQMEHVLPPAIDHSLLSLLSRPNEAVAKFFPNECKNIKFAPKIINLTPKAKKNWRNHVFCVRSLVYEMCIMSGLLGPKSLADLWLDYELSINQKSIQSGIISKMNENLTLEKFENLSINSELCRALTEKMKYLTMTKVQVACLPIILEGKDVFVKAKTGTGKTLAYLIPAIEIMIRNKSTLQNDEIGILIISPTKESAKQIFLEAKELLSFCDGINFVLVNDEKNIEELGETIHILVSTPGKLEGGIEKSADLKTKISKTKCFIVDEIDLALGMRAHTFLNKVSKIFLKTSSRHTMLFSSVLAPNVKTFATQLLNPGYSFIDTCLDSTNQNYLHLKQEMIVADHKHMVPTIAAILQREISKKDYKIIIFCPFAELASFYHDLFKKILFEVNFFELHFNMNYKAQTDASNAFLRAKNGILFCNDISLRILDYENISLVLQVGMTDRERYIDRLGRTSRAGKDGAGVILLYPFEVKEMKNILVDIPIEFTESIEFTYIFSKCSVAISEVASDNYLNKKAEKAYMAYLFLYKTCLEKIGFNKIDLGISANTFALEIGLAEPPYIDGKKLRNWGLKNAGLRTK